MSQASVELTRGFAFASFARAEGFGSTFKLSGSRRRSLELANERQQSSELVIVQLFNVHRLLSALVLQSGLSVLTVRFSAGIHTAAFIQFDFLPRAL